MQRVQLEQRAASRIRSVGDPILGLTSQRARLTNGRYSVSLGAIGSGVSECGGLDVSRWSPDPTCDSDGFHLYLRDLDDQFLWSAGYQPTRVSPDAYTFMFAGKTAEIRRLDREIECRTTVCVAPEHDIELRRCRLTNRGSRSRRIEVTSYVELVLATRAADANHPAFSKLFIETEIRPRERAILARRRPRGADEPEQWAFHRLFVEDRVAEVPVEFETNRKRFIGRGRTTNRPQALDFGARLAGDEGPVLDPIGCIRTEVSLAPGASCDLIFALGAAEGGAAIEELVAAIDDFNGAREILRSVEPEHTNGDAAQWIAHPAHHGVASRLDDTAPRRVYLPASAVVTEMDHPAEGQSEQLQFENSFGGFTADGREYVIRLAPDASGQLRLPPLPWVNVIANERAGCLVTELGAGYTWAGNSREHRLTAWHNDPVSDPHSEAFWIRDEEAEVFWSPMPGPTPADAAYEVRHGFGYTKFRHSSLGLEQETTVYVAKSDPVKFVRLKIDNSGHTKRQLTIFAYQHWSLGVLTGESERVTTKFDAERQAIFAGNPQENRYRDAVAFSTVAASDVAAAGISHTGNRAEFLGSFGDLSAPTAVAEGGRLDGRTGGGLDPCAAWQVPIELLPGQSFECTFVLGEAPNRELAAALVDKYRTVGEANRAFDEVAAFWRDTLTAVQIETPDPAIDLMVNGWLAYQNLSCRMWARSAYYQPGGAYGFRDQLQDSAALVYHRPDITRQQIVRHASQQFVEGDVLHWWHDDSSFGLRTRFSDDLVWLPFVTAGYVAATGDVAVLDEVTPFRTGPQVEPGHAERGFVAQTADCSATVYEHCCRALDRALTSGAHGLPLMGSGDWNDGMNRVGQRGKGESVWLGFFLHIVLGQMLPLCADRQDRPRVERYGAERERLAAALNSAGWDGRWYRRAYYDDGQPLGSALSDECQIDALAQAWAVLSGVAPRERADLAVDAVEQRLVDEQAGLIRLLAPPFDRTPHDPGYIKGYVPGVRENGGQYTHGVLFYIRALAEMGRGSRAVDMLRMLSPVTRSATAERAAVYQTEPYVVAADVYSEPPHVGRGGWTWYTGSAGWMYRVAVESVLGLTIDGGRTIVLKPAISATWPACRLQYRLSDGRTRYEITIENPSGKETGVTEATLDGESAPIVDGAARIALRADCATHRVVVRL